MIFFVFFLFIGGGTLGSVTSLLAVAEESQKKKMTSEVFFWGTRHGPDRALVEAAGIPFRAIPAGKLRRYWDYRNLTDPFVILWAFLVSLRLLWKWRPGAVVGAGAFVQVPVMWAAALLRIPIIIHQQDVRPGLANRLVAPFASAITATFRESMRTFGRRVEVVGNTVRREILAAQTIRPEEGRRRFGFGPDLPVVLIVGGGTGAQALNALVQAALPEMTKAVSVIHVTGVGKSEIRNPKSETNSNFISNYRQVELLLGDLPYAYAAADLVISRAGMGTITELVALGKPTVLVPIPGTHQEENAAAMADRGAMVVWHERDLTSEEFARRIHGFLSNSAQLASLARRCAQAFPTDAAGKIVEIIVRVAKNIQ